MVGLTAPTATQEATPGNVARPASSRLSGPTLGRPESEQLGRLGEGGSVWPYALRILAVACLFGTQVIHTSVMEVHFAEWAPYGFFFLGISLVEGCLGVALLMTPSRALCRAAIAVSLVTLAVWAVSRSLGLPFGPEAFQPESLARADLVSMVLGSVRMCALVPLVLDPVLCRASRPARRIRLVLGAGVVIAVGTLSVVGARGAGRVGHGAALKPAPPAPASFTI